MGTYIALLRGINVGGNNLIKMADLRACFEEQGFTDVGTYIQSGNVLFGSSDRAVGALSDRIERMLSARFGYEASVVLRSHRQMRAIVDRAPEGFGTDPDRFRSDVLFLKAPLTAATAIRQVPTRDGVDRAWAGAGVLYFERLTARATQSKLSAIASLPIYRQLTIRNWNTTTKLLTLMDAAGR